jgi:hypothetical protein
VISGSVIAFRTRLGHRPCGPTRRPSACGRARHDLLQPARDLSACGSRRDLRALLGSRQHRQATRPDLPDCFPSAPIEVAREQLTRVASKGNQMLGLTFAIGLAISLWSANAAMKSLFDTLNIVYGEKEKRGFVKLAASLSFTLVCMSTRYCPSFAPETTQPKRRQNHRSQSLSRRS